MDLTIAVPIGPERVAMLGEGDRNLKMIRETLGVRVTARSGEVRLCGEPGAVGVARTVLQRLGPATRRSGLSRSEVLDVIADEAARSRSGGRTLGRSGVVAPALGWDGQLDVFAAGRRVEARTANQSVYLEAIRTHDLVFGVGPAGTGKTYLAVAAAVHLLKTDRVARVVLVRPAVEAGERLGFLPGDLEAKVNPYLRPLLDALHDMVDYATIRRFMDADVVEIAPLAYMRGRTLNRAVVILDEAQNTTAGQMKMFLTRMGHGSKFIVTGDVTQIDLDDPTTSGLVDAVARLRRVEGVAIAGLDRSDVVRHALVQRVIGAYGSEAMDHTDSCAAGVED